MSRHESEFTAAEREALYHADAADQKRRAANPHRCACGRIDPSVTPDQPRCAICRSAITTANLFGSDLSVLGGAIGGRQREHDLLKKLPQQELSRRLNGSVTGIAPADPVAVAEIQSLTNAVLHPVSLEEVSL